MIDGVIERFAVKAPAATMFRALFARIFSNEALDKVFADCRTRQVDSPLLFSYLVNLLVPVVSGSRRSVHGSHQATPSGCSRQAVYDKLRGVEASVSAGLLRRSVEELLAVKKATRTQRRDVIRGYHTFVIDGKTYNATEHRLKESQTDARAPLPGRAVALYDTRHELFVDIECDPNAHRCEPKIVEPLLERITAGALYLADRNFSDGVLLSRLFAAGAYFIIRQHGACPSWRAIPGEKPQRHGVDSRQVTVLAQTIEVQLADGSWHKVRRLTTQLKSATRNGDSEIHLLSNLPKSVSARKISDAYRQRWTIETCLGHLARALNAEIRTLCYPGAAGLCFCLALVLFNIMSTLKALLLKHGQFNDRYEIVDLSYYYLADEISNCHTGMEILIEADRWHVFTHMPRSTFTRFLRRTASHALLEKYRKHPRGPNQPKPKRRFTGTRHVATQKLLDARK